MKPATKTSGIRGAISVGCLGGALVTLQFFTGSSEALNRIVWGGFCYPVTFGWEALFRLLGIEGDHRMAFILPMYGSAILYFVCLGFAIGVLFRKLSGEDES